MKRVAALVAGIAIGATGMAGWQHFASVHGAAHAPYAGQQTRQVSSLSAGDVSQLLAGQGWGLAKPAELNGYPGPRHVLDAAAELELTSDQRQQIQLAFDEMSAEARKLGEAYVAAERALDEAFRSGKISEELLRERLQQAQGLRTQLRQVHLAAHLRITPLLSDSQIKKYVELRGYGEHAGHAH